MKTKLLRKVRRRAREELGRLSGFGTTNGRVSRLIYPIGRDWVYEWMFGEKLDIYGNLDDEQIVIHKIARILWRRELKEYWAKKSRCEVKKPEEPSWLRKFITRIVNRLRRRKCKGCRFWRDYNNFATGRCMRTPFAQLCDNYSWEKACEYYEAKESGAANGKH